MNTVEHNISLTSWHQKNNFTRLSMVLLKVSSTNGAICLYTCLILQPIMSSLMCFFHYARPFPFWGKLVLDSSSYSSYMRSSFPNKFSHLKPSFFIPFHNYSLFSTIFCWRPQLDHFHWDNKVLMSCEKWIIILLNSVHPY